MDKYTKHLVEEMDNSRVQKCILCGAVINDYRNAMIPEGQSPSKGYSAGYIYVGEPQQAGGGWTVTNSMSTEPTNSTIVDCIPVN